MSPRCGYTHRVSTASTDITFRVSPQDKDLIRRGAELEGMSISNYLRVAALDRLRESLRAVEPPAPTAFAAEMFDALMDTIDSPDPVAREVRRNWEEARRALVDLDLGD